MEKILDIQTLVIEAKTTGRKPCILLLHGQGERGNGTDSGLDVLAAFINNLDNKLIVAINTAFTLNGKPTEFVLIAPQLPTTESEWQNGYIDKAYNHALTRDDVDPTRITPIGISLGGGGLIKYLSVPGNGAKFNAGIVICPAYATGFDYKVIAESGLPLWFFHANDDYVPVATTNSAVSNINQFNPKIPAKKTIYPTGGHWIWSIVLDPTKSPGINGETANIYQWALMNTNTVHVPVPAGSVPVSSLVADAGPDITITGTTATLDGTKSTGYKAAWWISESPAFTNANWVTNNWGIKVGVKDLKAGEYLFKLTVADGPNMVNDTVKIIVNSSTPAPIPTKKVRGVINFDDNTAGYVYSDKTYEVK